MLIRFEGTIMPKEREVASELAALLFEHFRMSKGFFVGQVHVVFPEKAGLHNYQWALNEGLCFSLFKVKNRKFVTSSATETRAVGVT